MKGESEMKLFMQRAMRVACRLFLACAVFVACAASRVSAQESPAVPAPTPQNPAASATPEAAVVVDAAAINDGRAPLEEVAVARGATGDVLLAGVLRTIPRIGTPEAPVENVRFVVENRSRVTYSYLSGRVTFYDATGVRCGEGLFTTNSLVAGEAAETDAPGLRLVCAPVAWRIIPVALVAGGVVTGAPTNSLLSSPPVSDALRLSIDINGTVLPVQLGNPVEVEVGGERVRIIVRSGDAAPGERP